MKKFITLSLSHVLFLCEFFIFSISTLDLCIYAFFRILLWVFGFLFLSYYVLSSI